MAFRWSVEKLSGGPQIFYSYLGQKVREEKFGKHWSSQTNFFSGQQLSFEPGPANSIGRASEFHNPSSIQCKSRWGILLRKDLFFKCVTSISSKYSLAQRKITTPSTGTKKWILHCLSEREKRSPNKLIL